MTDHIIHGKGGMTCKHCGFTQAVKMPVPIDDMLTQFDAFTEAHKGCTAPQSEAVMSEYIQGFDAGYSYVLTEVEQYIKRHDYDPRTTYPLLTLLAHLKAGDQLNALRETK
jgi:hypothetical protein